MEFERVAINMPFDSSITDGKWQTFHYDFTKTWIFVPKGYTVDSYVTLHRGSLLHYLDNEGSFNQIQPDITQTKGNWRHIDITNQRRFVFVPNELPTITYLRSWCPDIYYSLLNEQAE